jgi:transposase
LIELVLRLQRPEKNSRTSSKPPSTDKAVATTTPFGPRIHALAIYLKGFQALSYERLRGLFRDAFGLSVSEGALMNMFIRSHPRFEKEAEKAKAIVRAAQVVASDETGVRIEGTNSYHWVFHCKDAVVHQPDYSRAARVVDEMMAGHKPAVWISDRYSAQQKHGERHQTCLAHLARDTAFALELGSDDLPFRFKLWLGRAFDLARAVAKLQRDNYGGRSSTIKLANLGSHRVAI